MNRCANCNKPLRSANRRCGACADHKCKHGSERPTQWVPPPPLPQRVELYRRGRVVATVVTGDPDDGVVAAVRVEEASRRRVPVAAIVPVLRPARG